MKYGFLFFLLSALLIAAALIHGNWYLLAFWPAASFATIALGYLKLGPQIYGKSPQGRLALANRLLLLPYLCYLNGVWYLIRLFKREPAYHKITDTLIIGRRLLSHECPREVDHVIDLTCEFTESTSCRERDYHSFQVLDGFVPTAKQLGIWMDRVSKLDGTMYVHCAEGHGRTGLFTAALLLKQGYANKPSEALDMIIEQRPLVRLGTRQLACLNAYYQSLRTDRAETQT